MKGSAINGGDAGNRQGADFYPTPKECTIALLNFLAAAGVKFSTVCEPACGDGAISKILEDNMYYTFSSDLRESGYGKPNVNFLTCEPIKADALITNPPFNIADQFILKAVQHYDIVCMLLKSQYWHVKSRRNLFMVHTPAYILPLTWRPNFLAYLQAPGEKSSSVMDVAWTVWIRNNTNASYFPLVKPL